MEVVPFQQQQQQPVMAGFSGGGYQQGSGSVMDFSGCGGEGGFGGATQGYGSQYQQPTRLRWNQNHHRKISMRIMHPHKNHIASLTIPCLDVIEICLLHRLRKKPKKKR